MSTIINYKPYCGKSCEVTKVHKADIVLTENHLEAVIRYDYVSRDFLDDKMIIKEKEDYVKVAVTIPRASLIISRLEMLPILDLESDDRIEAVILECPGTSATHIKMKTEEEANKLYQDIKRWMISKQ
jgi:hypothetical protein